jgi:cellulose synthase/poly-beta-1,6-N-acetylglucosamine synthase-like glycosyltransferase
VLQGKNVILLHQGWGSQTTLLALPTIIETLQGRGYEFVTAAEKLGEDKSYLMPAVPQSQKFFISVSNFALDLIGVSVSFLLFFGLAAAIFGIIRILCIALAAFYGHYHHKRTQYKEFYPTVAVIVPALNEAKVILRTINSLIQSNYPKLQIVMVDDGSVDGTYEIARDTYKDNPEVLCLSKTNSGKANSINYALDYCKAEVVIIIDADTQIKSDAIYHLVQPFQDKRIGAVAGNAKVGNRLNLVTKFQALEYITSQNLDRRAFAVLNCIKVVPGAIGAWRLSAVKEVGGFTADTLAEDTDLTIKLLRIGQRVQYAEKAIAYTEAPDTFRLFMKQRFRWMYGTLQAIWKHMDLLFDRRKTKLGVLVILDALVFQIFFPLFAPIMDIYLIRHLIEDGWAMIFHQLSPNVFAQPLLYYLVFLILDYLAALISFVFEKKEDKKLLTWLFLQRFIYRQLLYIVSIRSLLTALKGVPVGWNKLDRKATVKMRS